MEYGYDSNYYVDYIGPTCTVYKDTFFWKAKIDYEWRRGFSKRQAVQRAYDRYIRIRSNEHEVMSLYEAKKYYIPRA